MNWEELNALIQRHGGTISTPDPVDPEIDNPDPIDRKLTPKIPNPNPARRYNLRDGKYFIARASGPGAETGQPTPEQGPVTFTIVDPGNAVQPLTPADRLPSAAQDLVRLDAQGNVIPAGSSTPAAKLRDPATGAVTDLPDPKTNPEGTLKEFGNRLLNIKPDGTFTVVTTKDAEAAAGRATALKDAPDGSTWEYDPNKPEGQRLTKVFDAPTKDKPAPTVTKINGVTFERDPATGEWNQAAGLPSEKPATQIYGTGPNDEWRVTLDDQGNEVSRVRNPNYVQPKPTQLTPDTVAANIPLLKPDGTIDYQPNRNQVTVNQAMSDLLGQVGVKVNAGSMSMADAKDLLTGTVNALNAQTAQTQAQTAQTGEARAAAGDILTATSQGATTGAGMLQNRVTNAQNMVQSALGLAGQGQRSGNLGGGLMTPLPGIGAQLVGGAQAWATELGGGQDVYDTAARLVKAADPNGGGSPMAQAAYGVLTQMLERYGQQFGPHPAVQATAAARASTQSNGMTAPAAQPTYNPAYASGGLGPVMAGQFTAPQVPQVQPMVQPQAFVAPLATNNLGNTDPRLRGLIY